MKPAPVDLQRATWLRNSNRYYAKNRDRIVIKRSLARRQKAHPNKLYPECAFLASKTRNLLERVKQKFRTKKWRAKNRHKVNAVNKRWRDKKPPALACSKHSYRARKRNLPRENCSKKIALLRLERFCRWCCIALNLGNRVIDHVIPLSRGGFHISDNLVAACSHCNNHRHNKLIEEWLPCVQPR